MPKVDKISEPEEPEIEKEEVVEDSEPEEKTPRLLAGKYKTVEDMEEAYKQAEQRMQEATTEAAQLRQQTAQIVAQVQAQQGQPTTTGDWRTEFNEKIWEDPAAALQAKLSDPEWLIKNTALGTLLQAVGQQQSQTASAARRNINAAVREKTSDPLWAVVGDAYQQALEALGDQAMADPQYAESYKDMVYKQVIGEIAIKNSREGKGHTQSSPPSPQSSAAMVRSLGVEQPGGAVKQSADVTRKDREILDALGLDRNAQKEVLEKYTHDLD